MQAAHAHTKLKQPAEAEKLLQRVSQDFAGSRWADLAKQRLKKSDNTPLHDLPAAVALLRPAVASPPAPETLGQYADERVSLDDPARALVWSLIMARTPGQRQSPFASQKLALPEPYENHRPLPLKASADEVRVHTSEDFQLP